MGNFILLCDLQIRLVNILLPNPITGLSKENVITPLVKISLEKSLKLLSKKKNVMKIAQIARKSYSNQN